MTPKTAAAERAVINAAKALERAAGYGINTGEARRQYDRARRDRDSARSQEGRA